jgi:pyridoxine 4-dehydrogenase
VPADEQFGALAEFVREGKVRHVGLSEVGVAAIEHAQCVVPIASVQNRYNVLDREWDDVVDYCDKHGIAFIPWYPLGAGSIEQEKGEKAAKRVVAIAERRGATSMQVALAWLLARTKTMLVIPGTSRVSHLEENVRGAELELSDEELESLNSLG